MVGNMLVEEDECSFSIVMYYRDSDYPECHVTNVSIEKCNKLSSTIIANRYSLLMEACYGLEY